jgi:hypothetical protein
MEDIKNWDDWDIFQNPWHITRVLVERWNKDFGKVKIKSTKSKVKIEFITGGFSDNEEIIRAIPDTYWLLYWKLTERGGRYVFEIPKEKIIESQKQIEGNYAS